MIGRKNIPRRTSYKYYFEGDFFKNLTETLTKEVEILKSQYSAGELQTNTLLPDGNIIISVIREVENAREIDYCAGASTSFGFITASSCCKAQEMILFDLEKSDEIKIEENSIWLEEHICFINTTQTFEFAFSSEDINEPNVCSIVTFDDDEGQFDEKTTQIQIQECFDTPCILTMDLYQFQNITILAGSYIVCQESHYFGIITKSTPQ